MSARSPTVRRILREAAELAENPSPDYTASPLDSDLFDWHFTFRGPPHSPYTQGIYHGRIVLPPLYPLRPPSFRFLTPSGRFEVNREICLSISGHHEETWQPAWGVRTALVALRSFMETNPMGQLGGLEMNKAARESLAAESCSYRCPTCARTNLEIIQACEERSRASAGTPQSVEVPSDLRMAWRDEMAAEQKPSDSPPTLASERPPSVPRPPRRPESPDSEAAELAEGFVSTSPSPLTGDGLRVPPSGVPTYDTAQPPPQPRTRLQDGGQPVHVQANNGVPIWVDCAITTLVVALFAMILKMLLGR